MGKRVNELESLGDNAEDVRGSDVASDTSDGHGTADSVSDLAHRLRAQVSVRSAMNTTCDREFRGALVHTVQGVSVLAGRAGPLVFAVWAGRSQLPTDTVAKLFLSVHDAIIDSFTALDDLDDIADDWEHLEELYDVFLAEVLKLLLDCIGEFRAQLSNFGDDSHAILNHQIANPQCIGDHFRSYCGD